jgi:hypothetical protein
VDNPGKGTQVLSGLGTGNILVEFYIIEVVKPLPARARLKLTGIRENAAEAFYAHAGPAISQGLGDAGVPLGQGCFHQQGRFLVKLDGNTAGKKVRNCFDGVCGGCGLRFVNRAGHQKKGWKNNAGNLFYHILKQA